MIKNIILDIGDVLVKSDYHEFFLKKGCDESTVERLEKATFFSPEWKELDRGAVLLPDIIDGFVRNDPGIEPWLRRVFNDMSGFVTAYPYAEEWVESLRQSGLKVFCLSNISDIICRDCADDMKFLDMVDGFILSYQEKLIKPDPEIFRLLMKKYGLTAEECVFIDDLEPNVNAAKRLGMHGIIFRNKTQAQEEIDKIRRTET